MRRKFGEGTLKVTLAGTVYCRVRTKRNRPYQHVLVAERALGHKLPAGAEVHHWYGDPPTLVICPSHVYHHLLHKREQQLLAKTVTGKSLTEILTKED